MQVFECAFVGYRSLRNIRFSLRRLNVFVGDNGVGKTNLYRALQLLQAAAAGTLGRELAMEGGMESAAWAGELKKNERPGLELEVCNSSDMQRAFKRARQVAQQELPVLINGESGTGKEMFAQAIHHASARAPHPFIAVNCGSIPRELLEAELFGYVSGAFTGARQGGNAGKFEQANGGTIFLDEVSELPLSGQVALLRVLQEMEITRVGSSSPIRLDVRVIAACNKNLLHEISAGRFRRDLYYRLNVLAIDLPPLRQRDEDIVMLAQLFLAEFSSQMGRGRMFFTPQALEMLSRYEWPGNIRELRNLVQRAAVLAPDLQIDCETLGEIEPCVNHPATGAAQAKEGAGADGVQRKTILEVLSQCSGNVSEASRRLGLSRMTIYRQMRRASIGRSHVLLPGSDEKLASG